MNERTFTIRGAAAVDGSGSAAQRADLVVVDGVIVDVWVCVGMCGYVWVCVGMCGYVYIYQRKQS